LDHLAQSGIAPDVFSCSNQEAMNCQQLFNLNQQLAALLENYTSEKEVEVLRIQVAIKDHERFWHPHNCK
jgi:hypothetical protein